MVKIGICDDDEVFCQQLVEIIHRTDRELEKNMELEVFNHSKLLLNSIREDNNYDILFLDISMPELNGIQIGNYLRNQMRDESIKIIYISSEPGYALDLFKIRPVDFIIKPIEEKKVREVLTTVLRLMGIDQQCFCFDMGKEHFRVPVSKILCFQSARRKIYMTTEDGEYEFYSTMEDVEKKLNSRKFIRIHKSYLINYDKTQKVDYREAVLSNGLVLAISQANRKEVRARCIELERRK